MNKIGIIIQREYSTRVLKKSFILLTFLTPLLFTAMFLVPIWLSSIQDNSIKHIVVIDKTGQYGKVFQNDKKYTFIHTEKGLEEIKKEKKNTVDKEKKELQAVLYLPQDLIKHPNSVVLYSDKQIDAELPLYISNLLNEYVRDEKLASYDIPQLKEKIEASKTDIKPTIIKWDADGKENQTSPHVAMIFGLLSAFLIYIFIMNYGSQVMNGVLQEKTSRIVEVIISSVKPFELMMGKIIGIALVGLTQFLLWILLTLIITSVVSVAMGWQLIQPTDVGVSEAILTNNDGNIGTITQLLDMFSGIDLIKILSLFLLYFLGGYLLYSSFFAAIGSAVDNETDTQQFTTPITIPIVFSILVATYSLQNPHGPLAFWCSLIPFTSPIVMMVRIPFDVPTWELLLSISILILSFVGSTWFAGKVYRTGILMYGKKVTWAELWKWAKQR